MTHTPLPARFLDRSTPPHIVTLVMLASVSALAMNIYLPSLPRMAEAFATTPGLMGLTVGIYLASGAVLQLFLGALADFVGRRPVLLAVLALYVLTSVAIVHAPSVTALLALRAVQAAASVTMVLSRAIVRDTMEGPAAAARLAYVTMGMSLVPMFGPVIGGVLGGLFGWEANFWVLALFGTVLWVVVFFDGGETLPKSTGGFRDKLADYPELFRSPRFWGYCLASAFASGAFFAYLGGAPFVGAEVYGLKPTELGFYFGAPAVGYFFGNFIAARISERVGMDRMILWGNLISVAGIAASVIVTALGLDSAESFFGLIVFLGLGNGLTNPNATAGLMSIRPRLAGTASGLGSSMMIGGGAALSAFAGFSLSDATGPAPLLWIMLVSTALSIGAILYVMRRTRQLAGV